MKASKSWFDRFFNLWYIKRAYRDISVIINDRADEGDDGQEYLDISGEDLKRLKVAQRNIYAVFQTELEAVVKHLKEIVPDDAKAFVVRHFWALDAQLGGAIFATKHSLCCRIDSEGQYYVDGVFPVKIFTNRADVVEKIKKLKEAWREFMLIDIEMSERESDAIIVHFHLVECLSF